MKAAVLYDEEFSDCFENNDTKQDYIIAPVLLRKYVFGDFDNDVMM